MHFIQNVAWRGGLLSQVRGCAVRGRPCNTVNYEGRYSLPMQELESQLRSLQAECEEQRAVVARAEGERDDLARKLAAAAAAGGDGGGVVCPLSSCSIVGLVPMMPL